MLIAARRIGGSERSTRGRRVNGLRGHALGYFDVNKPQTLKPYATHLNLFRGAKAVKCSTACAQMFFVRRRLCGASKLCALHETQWRVNFKAFRGTLIDGNMRLCRVCVRRPRC